MIQAKQILMKHLTPCYSTEEEMAEDITSPTYNRILAAMQEYAALTSPASGWVKATERLPRHLSITHCKAVSSVFELSKFTGWYDEKDKMFYKRIGEPGFPVNQVEWLSETPLPTVEECMEYAVELGIWHGMKCAFSEMALKKFIQYSQTSVKQD